MKTANGKREFRDGLGVYRAAVRRFPMLSAEEERHLARQWRSSGARQALDRLVTSHLRLVGKIARGFLGYGLPIADLMSAGNMGLVQAAQRFDPDRGFRFATYAVWWIRAEIQQYVLESWSLVRIAKSPTQKKLFFNLRRVRAGVKAEGEVLTPEASKRIAEILNTDESDVIEMSQRLSGFDLSLNAICGAEGNESWQDMLVDDGPDVESCVAERDEMAWRSELVRGAMAALTAREAAILHERRLRDRPETLDKLSMEYGVSRERIRQIESRALEKLRAAVMARA
ncbi:MAG TPA: RNA polymerase factor sigma-32 [Stellaceae bacterium]|nr:RNA polymerase factor sigma-32 [Stellaceae bacterium]